MSVEKFNPDDYHYMQRAITLAKKGHFTVSPNPRVGCVLVKNGEIIGEGYHQKAGEGHAEVNALRHCNSLGHDPKGSTAYVTLEPCSHFGRTPPCSQGLIDAGIARVFVGMVDPDPRVSGRGISMLEAAGIKTTSGLLTQEAIKLNPGFISLMTTGYPYVRCKLAASLDGKTAMANGESKWITSPQARKHVQELRAQSCAVISGADSIIVDNANMNVRYDELDDDSRPFEENQLRQPVRVIIDSKNRLTPDLALFNHNSKVIIIRSAIENLPQWPHFVEQVVCPVITNEQGQTHIDLNSVLIMLAERGYNDVLIESGPSLTGAFIEKDLVNEMILFQAPKLMGADAKSLVSLSNIVQLSDAKQLKIIDASIVGPDLKITATFEQSSNNISE